MEIVNAFQGRAEEPTKEETAAALGSSAEARRQLVDWLIEEQGVNVQEWS